MADTYLIANAPYGASDVLLVTAAASGAAATPTGGGTRRRHMGKSSGHPRQIQRTVRFRWHLTISVTGEVITPVTLDPLELTVTGALTAPTTLPLAQLTVAGHLTTRTQVRSPQVRFLNLDEEDELLLLDLL